MNVPPFWAVALLLVLGLAASGCHRPKAPASVIHMADPAVADQLTDGFYAVEGNEVKGNGWRWTGPDFSLALAPPQAASHGARLVLRVYFPETQIQKLGPMTLSAFVDGEELPPETFTEAGIQDFVRDVPACFLDTNVLPFKFSFDSYTPHSKIEGRDLGAVVLMAALEPK